MQFYMILGANDMLYQAPRLLLRLLEGGSPGFLLVHHPGITGPLRGLDTEESWQLSPGLWHRLGWNCRWLGLVSPLRWNTEKAGLTDCFPSFPP